MKRTLIALLACLPLTLGCKSFPQIVTDNGPAVLQVAANLGVRTALAQTHASAAEATQVRAHLAEARALIGAGEVPAYTLDTIANLLNARIKNELVRAAVQAVIVNLKSHMQLPVTGMLSNKAKVWVLAVLDGSISGCDAYLAGQVAAAGSIGNDPTINFR